jgi:hypothetical protein
MSANIIPSYLESMDLYRTVDADGYGYTKELHFGYAQAAVFETDKAWVDRNKDKLDREVTVSVNEDSYLVYVLLSHSNLKRTQSLKYNNEYYLEFDIDEQETLENYDEEVKLVMYDYVNKRIIPAIKVYKKSTVDPFKVGDRVIYHHKEGYVVLATVVGVETDPTFFIGDKVCREKLLEQIDDFDEETQRLIKDNPNCIFSVHIPISRTKYRLSDNPNQLVYARIYKVEEHL